MKHYSLQGMAHIPLLSFFTGGGLLDIGFIDAGFPIVWHNECEPSFITGFEFALQGLYGNNKPTENKVIQNCFPLQEVEAITIELEAFGKVGKPSNFGVIGGPPCPDFSSAGKHKGKDGANGFLSGVFVERILSLQPTFFVFENVPGLLRTAKHRSYLAELIGFLEHDYAVDINILNSIDFGVPQDRNRVFIVGFKRTWLEEEKRICPPKGFLHYQQLLETVRRKMSRSLSQQVKQYTIPFSLDYHWFPWPKDKHYHGAKFAYDWPSTIEFGKSPEKPKDIPDELMVGNYICDVERLALLSNGRDCFIPHSTKFKTINEGDVSRKSFKRLHRWRYSPSAAYGNNEVHLHPAQPRRLTVREVMRIQSVPDNYALPEMMPLSKKYKTIANGVPVKLATALADQIMAFLLGSAELEPQSQ